MKNKSNLSIPVVILRVAMAITILVGIFITISLIHSSYSPTTYSNVTLRENEFVINFNTNSTALTPPQTRTEYLERADESIYLNRLSFASKFRIWLQLASFFCIYVLIMKELLSFVVTVKTYSSFFINCTKTIQQLKTYIVILMVLSFIIAVVKFKNTMEFSDGIIQSLNSGMQMNLGSSFHYLVFLLVLIVLGRVFKEGERMKEENDLTI